MPIIDKLDKVQGHLDIEEKEGSGIFVRRFFILDKKRKILEYFLDDPQNFRSESQAVGSFNMQLVSMVSDVSRSKPKGLFFFTLTLYGRNHYLATSDTTEKVAWIKHFTDACKITVDADFYDDEQCDSIGSYTTEICGGIVHRIPIEGQVDSDFDSSSDELEKEEFPGPSSAPFGLPNLIKYGFCVKQGALRKNWKRRFFVLYENGISYFKSKDDKSPIKHINKSEIVEARVSVGIHLNKDSLFELVTPNRVFYIQAESDSDRDSWISEINKVAERPISKRAEGEALLRDSEDMSMQFYHRQMSEFPTQMSFRHWQPGYPSTL